MKKVRSKLRPSEIGVIKTFTLSPHDEIGEIAVECVGSIYYYNNLSELCEKWEDYEEPKEYWHIFGTNITKTQEGLDVLYDKRNKEIGNYFETKEEAEKAVEKLKAITRLKDKGFRFRGVRGLENSIDYVVDYPYTHIAFDEYTAPEDQKEFNNDLTLLFGGEE